MLRIGRFVSYTPYSVISGFMTGIGIIVMVMQTLPFLGSPVVKGGPIDSFRAWPDAFANFNAGAFVVAAVTLVVGVAWPQRMQKYLPPTVAALAAGTLLGVLWLTDVPVIGNVPTGLPTLQTLELSPGVLARAVQPALTIALLGSIDSLLTSLIADNMTRTRHNSNRELIGQGIGNMAAGLIGGLPGAGATLGTVVNLRAGGATRFSGVLRAGLGRRTCSPPESGSRRSTFSSTSLRTGSPQAWRRRKRSRTGCSGSSFGARTQASPEA